MSGIIVAVLNRSTQVKDASVKALVSALQIQVSRDFQAAWGIDAQLQWVREGGKTPRDAWQLVVFDSSDQAGALGYHDLTRSGRPLGKVFAGTDRRYGNNWTITASHELLEMLADPNINLVAFAEDENRLYAYEVCDACEADAYGYKIDGHWVSDFVFPGWFEPMHAGRNERFDFQRKIARPFGLLRGGYIGIYDIDKGSGWTQLEARRARLRYSTRPPVGSRRERRRTPKNQWLLSRTG